MRRNIPALICLLATAACGAIPRAELSSYNEAFDQAYAASDAVLLDFAKVHRQAKARVEGEEEEAFSPFPAELDGYAEETSARISPDIELRIRAMQVIRHFNTLLATLAEGKSIQQVQSASAELLTTIGSFAASATGAAIPGISAIVPLAQKLSGELENARLREEFRIAVAGGGPVTQKIFELMIADTVDHYTQHRTLARERQTLITAAAIEKTAAVAGLVAERAPPDDAEALAGLVAKINETLATFAEESRFPPLPIELPSSSLNDAPPLDALAMAIAREQFAAIADHAAAYAEITARVQAVGRMLFNYRRMLREASRSLDNLQQAVEHSVSFAAQTEEILKLALEIKQDIDQFKAALEKVPGEPN